MGDNHWELFFEQPLGFTLDKTLKYGKNIEYKSCEGGTTGPNDKMAKDKVSINFWHNFAEKYMPIKKEFILLINIINIRSITLILLILLHKY